MKRLLVYAAVTATFIIAAADVWTGKLKLGIAGELPLELTINEGADVSLCSPAQSSAQIPAKVMFRTPDSLSLSFFSLGANFQLKLVAPNQYSGTFSQRGQTYPITFEPKVKKISESKPYIEKEMTVHNGDVVLSGTLTLPENMNRQTPLAIMVTGSGKQNRDEELFQHKPFADIADYLAGHGVATYRYDDRGSYKSTGGKPEDETTMGYAGDAAAVIKAMRDARITDGPIGVIGHSEGGLIAWILKDTDFVISLAGPSVRGDAVLLYQAREIVGVSDAEIQAREKILNAVVEGKEITDSMVREIDPKNVTEAAVLAQIINSSPWMQQYIRYSPAEDIKALSRRHIPVLALYFGNDKQVPPSMNVEPIKSLASNFTIKVIEGINHILVECEDGSPLYYQTLPGPTSPKVLQAIGDFISEEL